MNEPSPAPPIVPPRPFDDAPRATPGGCGRPVLIGCGLAAILLGIGAIVFVLKAKSLLIYTMEQLKGQVVAAMPAEVTDAERARLDSAFAAAAARIRTGEIDPAALQSLQGKLMAVAEKAPRRAVSREDVLELTEALDRFGSGPAAEPAAPPAVSPEVKGDDSPPLARGAGTGPGASRSVARARTTTQGASST